MFVDLKYLRGYAPELQAQVRTMIHEGRLSEHLSKKYPTVHEVKTDRALYDYTMALKQTHMRSAGVIHKVHYDTSLDLVHNALGLHTVVSRIQGPRRKSKIEIRIASLFKEAAPEFLEMIVVHELAHLREREHSKAFYQLCEYMQPNYHQIEFDLRLYLTHREQQGAPTLSGVVGKGIM